MFKKIKTNLVFHPRFNVITFMTEVEILDGVLKIFTSNLNPQKNRKKKRWIMMKNDSCTLKIGPTIFLFLQRILCKRHFHYWSQKERTPFFSNKRKEHHNGNRKKKENTPSLLLNFHKTAINNIVVGYKYIGGKDGAVVAWVRIQALAPNVGWVRCWFSPLLLL